jgi:hypothetical protein
MRAMVFDRYGEPNVVSLREVPVPDPQGGEVPIRICYAGVRSGHGRSSQVLRLGQARNSDNKTVAAGIHVVLVARREELLADGGRRIGKDI